MLVVGAVKLIGQIAVGIGVSAVTKAFIRNITPSNVTKFGKVAIEIGSWFIGGALAVQAGKQWNKDVDNTVEIIQKVKQIKNDQEESKTEKEAE